MGAQINAFFFEDYKPFTDGLGSYVSQMHDEHGVADQKIPLNQQNLEIQHWKNDFFSLCVLKLFSVCVVECEQ